MKQSDSRTVGRSDGARQRARVLAAALILACQSVSPTVQLSAQLSPRDSALHALNRLAYGPRPGEADRVAALGVMRWIDQQLDPEGIDNRALTAREHGFKILDYDRRDLAQRYFEAQRERRERKLAAGAADTMGAQEQPGPKEQAGRRLAGQFMDLTLTRAALSERQLYEVMVDFWSNHFNV